MTLVAAVGVLCKENAIVVLPLMLLEDLSYAKLGSQKPLRRRLGGWLREVHWGDYLAVLPGMLLLTAIRYWIGAVTPVFAQLGQDNPIAISGFWTGRMTALKVFSYYLALIFWPASLSCDYSHHQIPLFSWTFSRQDLDGWIGLLLSGFWCC